MNVKFLSFILIFLISSSFYLSISAQEETASTPTEATGESVNGTLSGNETEPKLVASPDASTSYVFPNATNKREFPVATELTLLVGFTNKGSLAFNVTKISGSFMYPQDHRYFIQNFTKNTYNETVNPEELKAFVYKFSPDPFLEPRDYALVVSIFYYDLEGGNFTSVVYNSTITLKESDDAIDVQKLFTYVGLLGVVGLVGFVVYKSGKNLTKKSGRRVETGTQRATVVDNEWLEGTSAFQKSPKSATKTSPKLKPKKTN